MRVLITGATGLIGTQLTKLCNEKGIGVNYLTRSKEKIVNTPDYKGFYWNPVKKEIDEKAIEGVGTIIHLAGAGIAKRWTKSYKKQIIKSRTETAKLLFKLLAEKEHYISHIISASAIGIYPHSPSKLYFEDEKEVDPSFVGETVVKWEKAVDDFKELGIDVAKIRIGLVLAENGGMLERIKKPISLNMGAALGSGKQWQSWIHIDDVAGIFLFALQHHLCGIYNAVAPNPISNRELTEEIARQMDKRIWLPNVPQLALKAGLGKMSRLVLTSQLVSSSKIQKAGYDFRFINPQRALADLL